MQKQTALDRVLLFIEAEGMTRNKFERIAGLSAGYLKMSRGGFGAKKLEQIIEAFPQLNRVWLLTGEGEMYNLEYTPHPENYVWRPPQPKPEGKEGANFVSYSAVIERYEELLKQREEVLAQKDEIIIKRDEIIAKKDELIAQKDAAIQQLLERLMKK